ncbi:hypothetical protein [Flavobacterium sp. 5]|uniref:hypothetical protein n=1 Tax=Flavobacterium sp. 5 TaxID=2035199 RepID=UPI000C2CD365|nr:hypothetical protein [Flavobacterium sp. 5]PKB17023.1 hypothetical protein CLU82_2188 [Flavobacterium sp. 5]
MDNNTTYIDNYVTNRINVEEWIQYHPKPKEGKKALPKNYHYFRKKLYAEKSRSFLLLSLRYDDEEDIFRLRINGSLKKWYLNGNTLEELTKPQYEECYKKIAKKIDVLYEDLLLGRNTKIESGITIRLKIKFNDLLKCFVWYKDFERVEESDTTLYFRGKYYSFILYEKEIEIKSKNRYHKGRFIKADKPIQVTNSYLRFEVKVNSVCGVSFYKEKANTVGKIIQHWDEIIIQIQKFFERIEFINFNEAKVELENMTFSELKKFFMTEGFKTFGIYKIIDLLNKIKTGTNKTKYRNEIFSLLRSHISTNLSLREELLYEFEKKINNLIYNKLNTYSNSNKLLIEDS